MQTILPHEFDAWEKRFRTRFFNSIHGWKAVHLIGTKNGRGETNLAPFNSIVHVGAFPPLIGMVFRPNTVARHTYENIKTTGVFTINSLPHSFAEKAHGTAANYSRTESEFDAVGLVPSQPDPNDAPAVAEAPIQLFLREVEDQLILANQTHFLIGEVYKVCIHPDLVGTNGLVNTDDMLLATGLENYASANFYKRFDFARPAQDVKELRRDE